MMDTVLVRLDGGQGQARWMTELGEWIAARRQALGMTQRDLAQRAGISQQMVSYIETGARRWPSRDIRLALARALGVSHLEMLIGAGEIDPLEAGVDPASADPQAGKLQALARELGPDDLDSVLVFVTGLVNRKRGRAD